MNLNSNRQSHRLFQRALVLTCGALAHQAGARFGEKLIEAEGPHEGIAVLPVSGTEVVPAVAGALRQVSQVSVKESLAQRGWQMDRLEEVALYLMVDLNDGREKVDPAGLVELISGVAQQHFGLSVATLGVALLPESREEERSSLAALVTNRTVFDRGLLVLGMTNTMGLCLPDAGALAEQAAHILQALTITPLRDAPEWLAEQQGPGWEALSIVASAGVAVWPWSPAEELDALQRHWLKGVIEAWLAHAPEEKVGVSSEKWLATAALERDQLVRRLSDGREQRLLKPLAAHPQPWRVHETYRSVCLLPEQLPEQICDELAAAQKAIVAEASALLQSRAEEMLAEAPAGGLARLRVFLRHLDLFFSERQERMDIQSETMLERQQAVAGGHRRLAIELERYLSRWPKPGPANWLHILIRPWRWLRLAWQYHQMRSLAAQLVQLENEWRQWQWQHRVAAAAESVYGSFIKQVAGIEAQAEEVVAMLRSMRGSIVDSLPGPLRGRPEYVSQRLANLVEKPELEAVWAAHMMGGLGRQLTALDDSRLEWLSEQGRHRLAEKGSFSALEALRLIYPDEEALRTWWNLLWEGASPLWRCDEYRQGECIPTGRTGLTLVYGLDALRLQQLLIWVDSPHVRWLVGPDPELLVLRLKQLSVA
jgi:hypothetical protein